MRFKINPLVSSFVFISIGFIVGYYSHPQINPSFKEIRNKESYFFINPLLECENNLISDNNKSLIEIKKEISSLIDKSLESKDISFASIYFRDLNNGPWFGINEKELFSPASLLKVPLMIAYLKEAESNPEILSETIIFNKNPDYNEQNIKPENQLVLNQEYSIEELIERMIIYSDNDAYDILVNKVDIKKYEKIYQDLGIDISLAKDNPGGNIIKIKEYASLFRVLYNASYLTKEMSEKALFILSQTTYKNGLAKSIPKDITIAHKFGERRYIETEKKQLHDCGIVYLPQKPYLVCIMSKGSDFNKLSKFIQDSSHIIYKNLIKK